MKRSIRSCARSLPFVVTVSSQLLQTALRLFESKFLLFFKSQRLQSDSENLQHTYLVGLIGRPRLTYPHSHISLLIAALSESESTRRALVITNERLKGHYPTISEESDYGQWLAATCANLNIDLVVLDAGLTILRRRRIVRRIFKDCDASIQVTGMLHSSCFPYFLRGHQKYALHYNLSSVHPSTRFDTRSIGVDRTNKRLVPLTTPSDYERRLQNTSITLLADQSGDLESQVRSMLTWKETRVVLASLHGLQIPTEFLSLLRASQNTLTLIGSGFEYDSQAVEDFNLSIECLGTTQHLAKLFHLLAESSSKCVFVSPSFQRGAVPTVLLASQSLTTIVVPPWESWLTDSITLCESDSEALSYL